jgi:anti-sigma factor RsiW
MRNINERPVCHRAEDLVTYLYGEATAEEARDFAAHLQQCDACRAEFTVFDQVHNSIVAWRNEAIGSIAAPAREAVPAAVEATVVARGFGTDRERISAWAALREFFSVSPLWLRGATAFAGLLLCALLVFAVARTWQRPAPIAGNDQKKYSELEFQQEVRKQVAEELAKASAEKPQQPATSDVEDQSRTPLVTRRTRPKNRPANKLTHEEREQLAADLGLIPGRDDERPFVLPEEPDEE